MKSILSLDYELFFGSKVGTTKACIIDATNKLLSVLDEFKAKAVFFVDATYLLALKNQADFNPCLGDDYKAIVNHIIFLEQKGHQIQLHIHPHWMNSEFKDGCWNINTDRYRLIDWSQSEATNIIKHSVSELNSHLENKVFAYRAGGWCIQPFSHIADALYDCGIVLDSTVYRMGRSQSPSHKFDFTAAPSLNSWQFDADPCVVDYSGRFIEIPIASMRVSPLFYWNFAAVKLFGDKSLHDNYGDGLSIKNSKADIFRMMSRYSNSVVSVDGYKSSLLVAQYKTALKNGDNYFVVIGHPKALTPFSLINMREWLYCIKDNQSNLTLFAQP